MKKASFEARDEDERACEKEVVERARGGVRRRGTGWHLCDTFATSRSPRRRVKFSARSHTLTHLTSPRLSSPAHNVADLVSSSSHTFTTLLLRR